MCWDIPPEGLNFVEGRELLLTAWEDLGSKLPAEAGSHRCTTHGAEGITGRRRGTVVLSRKVLGVATVGSGSEEEKSWDGGGLHF